MPDLSYPFEQLGIFNKGELPYEIFVVYRLTLLQVQSLVELGTRLRWIHIEEIATVLSEVSNIHRCYLLVLVRILGWFERTEIANSHRRVLSPDLHLSELVLFFMLCLAIPSFGDPGCVLTELY